MMKHDVQGAEWRMVTITTRHRRGDELRPLSDGLMRAWRKTRTTRAVRECFDRYVTASARGFEVTWSARNGWHPHIHLVLRSREWSDEDQRTLETEWLARAPGLRGVAVHWSDTPLTYLSKLGAEVSNLSKLPKRDEHFNAWQLARSALTDARMRPLWAEYQRAMHGRRILELDERAKRIAESAPPPDPYAREWTLPLVSEEYNALASLEARDPLSLWLALDGVCVPESDPDHELRVYLDDRLPESAQKPVKTRSVALASAEP